MWKSEDNLWRLTKWIFHSAQIQNKGEKDPYFITAAWRLSSESLPPVQAPSSKQKRQHTKG